MGSSDRTKPDILAILHPEYVYTWKREEVEKRERRKKRKKGKKNEKKKRSKKKRKEK